MPSDGSLPGPRLRVNVVDDDGRPVRAPALASWLARVAPARAKGAVTVAVVSDRRVRALNRRYRGLDRATDVLSFPASPTIVLGTGEHTHVAPATIVLKSGPTGTAARHRDRVRVKPGSRRARFLGDIVIARGVATRQAREAGHAERTEWRVLALHGLLHLLGYDHEHDAGEMQRVEQRLRRKGGLTAGLIERRGDR